jgi:hypothetical protein
MTTCEITFNEKTNAGKEIFAFLQQYKDHIKLKHPAKMTKKEFDAKIQKAREQYARGEYTEVPFGQQSKFLQELLNEEI